MTVTIDIPDEIYERISALALSEQVTLDEVFAALCSEHFAAWDRLQRRAGAGSIGDLRRILAKVPDVEPEEHDRIPQ